MIIKKKCGDHYHIFSDKGLKIRQVQTGRVYSEAYETKDCIHQYKYEEIEGEN